MAHELGHTVGLKHEGLHGGENCSPVYPSIMDYPKLYDPQLRQVGFSDGSGFSVSGVNPSNPCEAEGLGILDTSFRDNYGRRNLAKLGLNIIGSGVDWNRDGRISSCQQRVRELLPAAWPP
jgi:hypothetical protein